MVELKQHAESLPDHIQNTLLGGAVSLKQLRQGYRASIDTVLLAAAVPVVNPGESILDLGTGVGGALFCYLTRVQAAFGVGLEVSEPAAVLARQNLVDNQCENRGEIILGDVAAYRTLFQPGCFAQVFANPPFHAPGSTEPPDAEKARAKAARHETLPLWIDAALWTLRPKGGLTLIHRADQVDRILAALYGKAGAVEIIPIRSRLGKEASRVLVRARKGVKTAARIHPDFILHPDISDRESADQKYTDAAQHVLNHPYPLF